MEKPSPDKSDIFAAAESFIRAAKILNNPDFLFGSVPTLMPCFANLALGIELYLKTLLAMENKWLGGHDLYRLFMGLNGSTRQTLEDGFNEAGYANIVRDSPNLDAIVGAEVAGQLREKTQLIFCLKAAKDAHVNFRYYFQGRKIPEFNLSPFPKILRKLILEKSPELAELPPSQAH